MPIPSSSAADQAIRMFPNPSDGAVFISLPAVSENTNLEVYNALGELIVKQPATATNIALDLKNKPSGIYFIHVNNKDSRIYTTKFIKQ